MTRPRKHHYLPKFYLREFSHDRQSLHQIHKKTGKSVPGSVENFAAIRDYHRLDHDETDDQFQLEKQLATVEDILSGVLRKVLKDGIENRQSHARMVEFVSLLRFRVPAIKIGIEQGLRQIVRTTGLILERKGQLPTPPKEFEEALRSNSLKIEISNSICLQLMFRLACDPDILNMMLSMHPTVVQAGQMESFLTCDQPVAVFNPNATLEDPYGVALIDLGTEISVPLSKKVLLLLTWNNQADRTIDADSALVAEYNRRTAIMATSYVFSAKPEEWVLGLVKENSSFYAGIEPPEVLALGDSAFHKMTFRPVLSPEQYERGV